MYISSFVPFFGFMRLHLGDSGARPHRDSLKVQFRQVSAHVLLQNRLELNARVVFPADYHMIYICVTCNLWNIDVD